MVVLSKWAVLIGPTKSKCNHWNGLVGGVIASAGPARRPVAPLALLQPKQYPQWFLMAEWIMLLWHNAFQNSLTNDVTLHKQLNTGYCNTHRLPVPHYQQCTISNSHFDQLSPSLFFMPVTKHQWWISLPSLIFGEQAQEAPLSSMFHCNVKWGTIPMRMVTGWCHIAAFGPLQCHGWHRTLNCHTPLSV